jgi:HK97 family phage major capsid protein
MAVKLEKEMYNEARRRGITFRDLLEEIDPTPERNAQGDIVGLDAYQRQLKAQGIKTSGPNSSLLEKFFATTSSAILFPHYVETQVLQGMQAASILPQILATTTRINSHTYDAVRMSETAADRQLRAAAEGAALPTTTLATTDESIKLKKHGRLLMATYEALRLQKLNVVGVFLQRLGAQIGVDESNEALRVIIGGDGNTGTGITDTDSDVSGTLDYDEMVKLWLAFDSGYECNTIVAYDTHIQTILNMDEFKDPMAGFKFQATGQLVNPLGARLVRWADTDGFVDASANDVSDWVIGIDRRYCLEQVVEQDVTVEVDRLIDKQFERTAVSKWTGFKKLDPAAAQAIDVTHA